ncbi:MAG TPA: amidase family protein, partial [Burkholderiales bacterium]|nr:amidase family protein [Burkholderiales bacterium]
MSNFPFTATECIAAFNSGEVSASEIATASLERIRHANPALNAFIEITGERTLSEARLLDAARKRGASMLPLAAVPYAVKNLFDVEGITTLAGARLYAHNPPARRDGKLLERLHGAGGLLAGTLNMDAYAYGFTTE